MQRIHTVIIGGGQAGLAVSYDLQQKGIEHVILEQAALPAYAWREQRWDSFALNTPNWCLGMPGAEYEGDDPDGLLPRGGVVAYFENYVERFKLPVLYGVCVTAVEPREGDGWQVITDQGTWHADNVVVATGLFQKPKIPAFARDLSPRIAQLHSSEYRNPGRLPEGAVLVIGSAQSGCQIAEDLHASGRRVFLSVGSAGRVPRRYRGRDSLRWLKLIGFFDRTPDKLPSPRIKFAGNPQISSKMDGPPVNLHYFARQGMQLLGRLTGGMGDRLTFAPDLHDSLAKSDQIEVDLLTQIDSHIAANGIDAPAETPPALRDGYNVEPLAELDLSEQGIKSILWAHGYAFDFSLVRVPVTDGDGYPTQQRGVTEYPGLYFIGLPWLSKFQSGLILGVGEDAGYIVAKIAG